jgi:hypothetical protein
MGYSGVYLHNLLYDDDDDDDEDDKFINRGRVRGRELGG